MNTFVAAWRRRSIETPVDFVVSSRLAAYSELAKPRIGMMVLITVAVGYILGSHGVWNPLPLLHASLGILLAVVSSSALNQWVELETDAAMERTKRRPLPSGRLSPKEVFIFGVLCGIISVAYLFVLVNTITACLTAATIVMYAGLYTPLKRYTAFCTVIGAIPGALPPVLGWAATGNSLSPMALSLFTILFVWQFPHFLAIAWIYRPQYEAAKLRMLPAGGNRRVVACIAVGYACVLIPLSLMPMHLGYAGDFYGLAAVLFGLIYAVASGLFAWESSRVNARRLLFASFLYLPSVLLVLTVDHLRLLN